MLRSAGMSTSTIGRGATDRCIARTSSTGGSGLTRKDPRPCGEGQRGRRGYARHQCHEGPSPTTDAPPKRGICNQLHAPTRTRTSTSQSATKAFNLCVNGGIGRSVCCHGSGLIGWRFSSDVGVARRSLFDTEQCPRPERSAEAVATAAMRRSRWSRRRHDLRGAAVDRRRRFGMRAPRWYVRG
jgi:hypothetical protein